MTPLEIWELGKTTGIPFALLFCALVYMTRQQTRAYRRLDEERNARLDDATRRMDSQAERIKILESQIVECQNDRSKLWGAMLESRK